MRRFDVLEQRGRVTNEIAYKSHNQGDFLKLFFFVQLRSKKCAGLYIERPEFKKLKIASAVAAERKSAVGGKQAASPVSQVSDATRESSRVAT